MQLLVHEAQERKYAARVGLRLCRAMRARRLQAYTYYYAIFNYCVGASGVPASVLNIVGNQPLYTDPMPLSVQLEHSSKVQMITNYYVILTHSWSVFSAWRYTATITSWGYKEVRVLPRRYGVTLL